MEMKDQLKPTAPPNHGKWIEVFFFICFGWIAYQAFRLAEPFLPGVLGAVMLGILFFPLYQKLLRRVRNPNAAALLLTIGIFLVTMLPVTWMGWLILKEADTLRPTLAGFIDNYRTPSYFQGFLDPVFRFFEGFHIELKPLVLDKAAEFADQMSAKGSQLAGHLLIMLFNGIVMLLTLFFVFRDGKKASEAVIWALPMSRPNKEDLIKHVYATFRAVVAGVFVTAVVEGLADMTGFFVTGVPLAVFFGLAVAVFSLLGASVLITIPAAFWVMNHDTGWGIALLLWGILISIFCDNVLKSLLIGSQARMPFLLMFFSTLGGIKLYGFVGLFLGPMVVTAFLTFWTIYRRDFKG